MCIRDRIGAFELGGVDVDWCRALLTPGVGVSLPSCPVILSPVAKTTLGRTSRTRMRHVPHPARVRESTVVCFTTIFGVDKTQSTHQLVSPDGYNLEA